VPKPSSKKVGVSLFLSEDAVAIMNRLRGDMSPDEFIDLLIRMVDSGAVGPVPSDLPPGQATEPPDGAAG